MRERLGEAGLAIAGDSPLASDALESGAPLVVFAELDALPAGRRRNLPAFIIVSDEVDAVPRAAAAGAAAWGVVPSSVSPGQLTAAIEAVRLGLAAAPPAMLAGRTRAASESAGTADEDGPREHLTPRERHVLELAADGRSNRAIAEALGISEHTVKFHLASIYGKLGASTRTGAVRRGLRRGLITI